MTWGIDLQKIDIKVLIGLEPEPLWLRLRFDHIFGLR